MLRSAVVFAFASAITLAVAAGASGASAQQVTWRVTHVVSGTHPFQTTAEFISARVGELTNGQFKFEIVGGGRLGDEVSTMDLYKTGDIDMGYHYTASAATVVAELGMLNFPFLFSTEAEWEAFMTRPQSVDYWRRVISQRNAGFQLGVVGTFGTKGIYTRSRMIRTADDLRGLRFRVTPSPVLVEAWRRLGAEPVAMAYGEVYTAIQTGVLDGADNAPSGYNLGKHYEVARNYFRTDHEVATAMLFMRDGALNSLPASHRAALDRALSEAQAHWISSSRSFARRVEQQFPSWRVNDVSMTPAFIAEVQTRIAPLRDQTANRLGVRPFIAELDAFRASRN